MKINKKVITFSVLSLFALAFVGALVVDYLSNNVKTEVDIKLPIVVGISEGKDSWATAQCYRPAYDGVDYYNPGPEVPDWEGKDNDGANYPGGMVDCFPEGIDGLNGALIKDWSEDDWTRIGTLEIDPMYTGQDKTFTLYLMSTNVAPDTKITGHEEIIVYNPLGITCEDFEDIKVRTDSIYGELGYGKEYPRPDNPNVFCHTIDNKHIEILSDTDTSTWGTGETDVAQWVITFNDVVGTYTFSYRVVPITA